MTFPERNQLQNFDSAHVWFGERFGVALPLGLREQADAMSWAGFVATYGRTAGPLRLGDWQCADDGRAATRLGPQPRDYRAVIAVGDRISTFTAAASGPIAALTAMLHERGITVEVVKFHQMRSATGSATFIRGSDGVRTEWAMGWADDPTQSALRAVIACANRLFAARCEIDR
ncbi:homocitrate synthase [Mycobacterium colombiense]|uniref:homocitrate synthase n=1 Tax=Mycobacterium colombiense TaxID=339268 RepID=UPI00096E6AA9|nr:homocitrate synthase [Mycobacterium colombiense]OMC23641.1 homocitrate synthase [Mycobacterium colombiense]